MKLESERVMGSSPPHSTSVASISESSATQSNPTPSTQQQQQQQQLVDGVTGNGMAVELEKKPQLLYHYDDLYSPEYMEKYRKYEAEHTRMLMSTYFSEKNFYGGDVFNEKTAIGGEVIQSSRWPCTRAFADPVQGFEDHSSSSSTSVDDVPNDVSNGNPTSKD